MPKVVRQARFRRPPGATEVFLVRHGESEPAVAGQVFPLVDGHGDPALAPEGREQAERVADQIDAGMVYVNIVGADAAELPFGGTKRSGFGRELGVYGADEFVNKKLIRVG